MSGSFDGFDFLQQRVAVLSVQGLNCQQGLAAEQGEDLLAQFQHDRIGFQPAAQPLRQRRDGRADIADHLGVWVVDLLDRRRLVADMDHLRPAGALHQEGRLLDEERRRTTWKNVIFTTGNLPESEIRRENLQVMSYDQNLTNLASP